MTATQIKVRDLIEGMQVTADIQGLSRRFPKRITRIEASSYSRGGMRIWVEGSDEMIGLSCNATIYVHA